MTSVRILRPLGTCQTGDFLSVEFDGYIVEGRISFMARTPSRGWIVSIEASGLTLEIYCADGRCTVVSQLAGDDGEWWFEESHRPRSVIDSVTGQRFLQAHA